MEQMTFTEKRFFQWYRDDVSVNLRASGGSYGGGSEVLVVETENRDDGLCDGNGPSERRNYEGGVPDIEHNT